MLHLFWLFFFYLLWLRFLGLGFWKMNFLRNATLRFLFLHDAFWLMQLPPEWLIVQKTQRWDESRQSLARQEVGTFALAGLVCRWRFSTWIQASGSGWDAGGPSGSDSWLQELASPESWASEGFGGDFSTGEEAERNTTRHTSVQSNRLNLSPTSCVSINTRIVQNLNMAINPGDGNS